MPEQNDLDERVRIHLMMSKQARRALRIAAASRGVSIGDLVEHWALMEVRTVDLKPEDRRR